MSLDNIAKLTLLRKNIPLNCIWPGLGQLHMAAMRNLMVRKGKTDKEFIELMNDVFNNIHSKNIKTIGEILDEKDVNGEAKTLTLFAQKLNWCGLRVNSLLAKIHLGVSLEDAYIDVVANHEMSLIKFEPVKKITGFGGGYIYPQPQKEHDDWAARIYALFNSPVSTSVSSDAVEEPSAKRLRTD